MQSISKIRHEHFGEIQQVLNVRTKFHLSLTIPSTPKTTLSFVRLPSCPGSPISIWSTQVSGTTLAQSSWAIHSFGPLDDPGNSSTAMSLLPVGGSCTRKRPSLPILTHKQQGNGSGAAGFGPSFNVNIILEVFGTTGASPVLAFLGLGPPAVSSDLRLFLDLPLELIS